jgi:hypothetical protein
MRAILSKAVAVSMIAGAGLLVTACGGETTVTTNNTTVEDVTVENTGAEETMTGTVDGANVVADNAVVVSNETTTTTETTVNTTN